MNSDRLLRDYLDGLLTASAGVGRDPDDRSDATPGPDDLPERLRRAERCQALLAGVWGTDDRSTPPAEPESVPSSSCPPDELALERLGPSKFDDC